MTSKFSPKLGFTTALISSAVLVTGCATDPSAYGTLRPIYRTQGDLPVNTQSFYEDGKRYFNQKRYGLALEAFQSELRYNGKSVKSLNGIAACYDKLNRYDLSVRYYYQALSIDSESTRTLSNLGYSYLLQKRDEDAKRVFALALNKDPDNAFIKRNLALANSNVQMLAKKNATAENKHEVHQTLAANEKPAAEITTLAADMKPSEESSTVATISHRVENTTSVEIVQTDESESNTSNTVQKVESEPMPTVDINNQAEAVVAEAAVVPHEDKTQAIKPVDVALSEPEKVLDPVVEDSSLMPAIDISSQAEVPVVQVPVLPRDHEAPAKKDIEVAVSEPAEVTEPTVVETPVLPQEDKAPAIKPVEVALSEPEKVLDPVVEDSSLMPAIDISSQAEAPGVDEDPTINNIEVATSNPTSITESVVADSRPLPAIDIIREITEYNEVALEHPEETSSQVSHSITTIDVDNALAEVKIVKLDDQPEASATLYKSDKPTIEISNGNGWNGMARLLGNHLMNNGEPVNRFTNADTFNYANTVIYYTSGKRDMAEHLASQFPMKIQLEQTSQNRHGIDVRMVIGKDITTYAQAIDGTMFAWRTNGAMAPLTATVEISNGNGRRGMAGLLSSILANRGDTIRRVTNADNFKYSETIIYFSEGRYEDAQQLAAKLPGEAILKKTRDNRNDIDLRVVLGKDFLNYEVAMRHILASNA